jgi:2'-5' RNA ligase
MPETTRTFLAVAVPAALETRLRRLQQQVAAELPGLRLAETAPFHVTLTFLGDVDNADLNALCRASAEAAEAFVPFELKLDGLGVFPNAHRPRVVWAGVTGAGVETLTALQAALAESSARLRYPADGKAYHPHVTLARFPPGRKGGHEPADERTLNHLLSHYKTWHAGPFGVTEAVVFSSSPGRDGPTYTPLARAPLRGRKPAAPA